MTERCEVLVVGRTKAAVALAQGLHAHGIDVRLADADTEMDSVSASPQSITTRLRDHAGSLDVTSQFLITQGEPADRDGRWLRVRDSDDAENLDWKLASVLRGAAEMLLDTYVAERSERSTNYRLSPLSQRFDGKHVRVHPGQRVPDDLVLWSPADSCEVRLWPALHWTVLGFGSASALTVQAVRAQFGDRVNAQVIGGGNSPSEQVTLLDRYGHVNRRLAKRGGSVLAIRPDRYVGLQTAPDPEIVVAYLQDLIPAASAARNGTDGPELPAREETRAT